MSPIRGRDHRAEYPVQQMHREVGPPGQRQRAVEQAVGSARITAREQDLRQAL